jgi:hypothetical protein
MFRNGSRVAGLLALVLVVTTALAGSPAPASAAATGPQALWDTTVTPPCMAVAGDPCGIADANGVELGVRFQTSQAISIVGVRFYRGDAGTWAGSVWDTGGSRLQTAPDSTTGAGWQDAMFATPVAMVPGQTFIASYFATAGGYAWQHDYFADRGLTHGPVTALQSVEGNRNGVYRYNTATAFPTDSFMDSNYWVTPLWVPRYTIGGFYQPVAGGGVFNTVKGGSTVPLKFEVSDSASGVEQTDPSVVSRFTATPVPCPNGTLTTDEIELTTTGETTLRYDLAAGQFIQNWKTPKKAGACYEISMLTTDGSSISAKFLLK